MVNRRSFCALSVGSLGATVAGCLGTEEADEPAEETDSEQSSNQESANEDDSSITLTDAWEPPGSFNAMTCYNHLFLGYFLSPRRLELVSRDGSTEWESDPVDDEYGFRNDGGNRVAVGTEYVCYGSRGHDETNRAQLYCFSRETGELLWTHQTEDSLRDIRIDYVSLGDGQVYYGTGTDAGSSEEQDPFVRAVDLSSGEQVWETSFRAASYSGLTYHNGSVYALPLSQLRILDPDDGSELDSYPFSTGIGGFAEYDDTLYGISGDVYAFDLSTDEPVYTEFADRRPDSQLAFDDQRIYAGDDNGWFDAYDLETGDRVWSTRVASRIRDRPAITEQHVWIIDNQDNIYAFDQESGEIKYERDEERAWRPVAVDNTLMMMIDGRSKVYEVES